MITLYTWTAPSGRIVSIALEEMELPYRTVPIDLKAGVQRDPSFLALNLNAKIPAIRDEEAGLTLAESGPILQYLADKSGRLLSANRLERFATMQWMSWAATGLGPTVVQLHHFRHFNRGVSDYSEARFAAEAERFYSVLERRLQDREYIVDTFSIADISAWPWISRFQWQGIDLARFPKVKGWYLRLASRPGFQRGYHVPSKVEDIPLPGA